VLTGAKSKPVAVVCVTKRIKTNRSFCVLEVFLEARHITVADRGIVVGNFFAARVPTEAKQTARVAIDMHSVVDVDYKTRMCVWVCVWGGGVSEYVDTEF
jgi:hypothetical protein